MADGYSTRPVIIGRSARNPSSSDVSTQPPAPVASRSYRTANAPAVAASRSAGRRDLEVGERRRAVVAADLCREPGAGRDEQLEVRQRTLRVAAGTDSRDDETGIGTTEVEGAETLLFDTCFVARKEHDVGVARVRGDHRDRVVVDLDDLLPSVPRARRARGRCRAWSARVTARA